MRAKNCKMDDPKLCKVVADFCFWQEATGKILRENEILQKELKNAHKSSVLDQEAAQAKTEEATHLRGVVDKLHGILAKRCDSEEENRQLKNEIKTMTVLSAELEKTHSSQMTEALENLNTRSETYKAEIASQQHQAQLKLRQEMDDKEKEIQDKITEIKLLQREKAEVERMRHTDIVKLRLEYDAKMLKLQKAQNTRAQQATAQPSSTNDIFRKKLQHVKAESEREIAYWKRKVEELERQCPSGNRPNKRTKLV